MATARSRFRRSRARRPNKWEWTPKRRAAFKRMRAALEAKNSGRSRRDLLERGGKVRRSPSRKPLYAGRSALTDFAVGEIRGRKKSRGKKPRTAKQIAATARMLAARRRKFEAKRSGQSRRDLIVRGGKVRHSPSRKPQFEGRSALAGLASEFRREHLQDRSGRAAASSFVDRQMARIRAESAAEREAARRRGLFSGLAGEFRQEHLRDRASTAQSGRDFMGFANRLNAKLRSGEVGHMGGMVDLDSMRPQRENRGRWKRGRKSRRYCGY